MMADKPHTTATASDIWTGGAPNSLRLTRAEDNRLNDWHSTNKNFAFLNDDAEFRDMLDALAGLQRDIEQTGTSARVGLSLDYKEESFKNEQGEHMLELGIAGAGRESRRYEGRGDSHQPLHLQADVRHDGSGNLDIRLAAKSYLYRFQEHRSYRRECEGPTAIIAELSRIMVRNNEDLKYIAPLRCKSLLFLRTLCSVVARSYREPDPRRKAENRWAAAATGAWEAVETTGRSLPEAMGEAWDNSRLSRDCPGCQGNEGRAVGKGTKRLMEVATGELVEEARDGEHEYAAVSYCWGSVTSDQDLLAQVKAAVAGTPIAHVWVDRFCLSAEAAARQEEVHNMSAIYAEARLVVILPGGPIPELDALRYDANGTAVRVTAGNRRRIEDQWTRAEWRSRCWTFQEASMARAIAVVTGSRKQPVLSGAALDALATVSTGGEEEEEEAEAEAEAEAGRGASVKLAPWHPLDDTWLRANSHRYEAEQDGKYHLFARSHRVCGSCGRPRDEPLKKQQLLTLMGLSWHRKASREQDTVYALLSMAEGGDRVPVQYDVTLEALYRVLIQTKVVGAEIMALGGGYVGGPATSWMPHRGDYTVDTSVDSSGKWLLRSADAGITDRGTLSAAVVPVTISTNKYGETLLRLAGLEKPLTTRGNQERGTDWLGFVDGWQAHALAPLTSLDWPSWRLVLVFSSGEGRVRRVEKSQVLRAHVQGKRGMESLAIETIEYES